MNQNSEYRIDIDDKIHALNERIFVQSEQIASLIKLAEGSQSNHNSISKDLINLNIEISSAKSSLNTARSIGIGVAILLGWFCQHQITSYENYDLKQQSQIEENANKIDEVATINTQQNGYISSMQKQINDIDNRVTIMNIRK